MPHKIWGKDSKWWAQRSSCSFPRPSVGVGLRDFVDPFRHPPCAPHTCRVGNQPPCQNMCPTSSGPAGCWVLLLALALPCSHGQKQAHGKHAPCQWQAQANAEAQCYKVGVLDCSHPLNPRVVHRGAGQESSQALGFK